MNIEPHALRRDLDRVTRLAESLDSAVALPAQCRWLTRAIDTALFQNAPADELTYAAVRVPAWCAVLGQAVIVRTPIMAPGVVSPSLRISTDGQRSLALTELVGLPAGRVAAQVWTGSALPTDLPAAEYDIIATLDAGPDLPSLTPINKFAGRVDLLVLVADFSLVMAPV